jgi:hypothetical protein
VEETQGTKGCTIRTEATRSMCPPLTARLASVWGCVCTEGSTHTHTHTDTVVNKQHHVPAVAPLPCSKVRARRKKAPAILQLRALRLSQPASQWESPLREMRCALGSGNRRSTVGSSCCWPPRTVPISAAATSLLVDVLNRFLPDCLPAVAVCISNAPGPFCFF